MTVLVDTNVLLDVLVEDPNWLEWSSTQLAYHRGKGRLAINPLILAELAFQFDSLAALNEALPSSDFIRLNLPWEAAYEAGRRFVRYRQRGGPRFRLLPDFYIGAHVLVEQLALLTRDPDFYRTNYPEITVISPDRASGSVPS